MSLCQLRHLLAALAAFLALAEGFGQRQVQAADTLPIEIRQVEIGYGGTYKSGFWAPIWVTLRAQQNVSGKVVIMAPDSDQVPVAHHATSVGKGPKVELPANVDTTVSALAKIGPEQSTLTVQLRDPTTNKVLWNARLPATTSKPLPSKWELIVSLGESPAAREAAEMVRRGPEHRVVAASVVDPARVPEHWFGWEGVETIVISTTAGGLWEKLSPQQWLAISQWVEIGGGRLVICVGERARDALAADSPLSKLTSGTLVDVSPLRDLGKLEELTGQPLTITGDASRPQVAHMAVQRGRVEATVTGSSGEMPLMVRASHGFGEVVVLSMNPDGPALATWPGKGGLLLPALTSVAQSAPEAESRRRGGSRLGYDDLTGQLRAALDFFPQVRVVNVTTVAVLTLVYLALIGPVDFLLQRRLKWPSVATWLSFPLLIVLFCVVGWNAARSAHGTVARINHCEIVDIDAERQIARGTVWVHAYNPKNSVCDVSLSVDPHSIGLTEPAEGWVAWQGLPGNGLGGLAANQLAPPTALSYEGALPGRELSLADVPIQIAGSKALSARWWGPCEIEELPLLTLNPYGLLEGEITNPLPVELHESLLIHDEHMYRLHTISPGQRVRVADLDMLNLEARLQQRTIAGAKDVISPWERDSSDVPRIVQMLMFHESARGSTYTNLAHRYQGYLDLTPRVHNGRAILVGRTTRSVTQVALDGEPFPSASEPWTWVRVVLPVSPRPQPARRPQ